MFNAFFIVKDTPLNMTLSQDTGFSITTACKIIKNPNIIRDLRVVGDQTK